MLRQRTYCAIFSAGEYAIADSECSVNGPRSCTALEKNFILWQVGGSCWEAPRPSFKKRRRLEPINCAVIWGSGVGRLRLEEGG